MEVSTSTCKFLNIVFVVIMVCQTAVAMEQYDLLPCTEVDSGGMLYCIEYDSMGEIAYLNDNITRRITVKLPLLVLTQLWLNQSAIVIVASLIGEAINKGQELIRDQDRERWTIVFNFQYVNSDYGMLHLIIHIKDVKHRDKQSLHVEIKTTDNIFMTRSNVWFPVAIRPTDTSNDHEGEAITPQDPASEDPSAILHARIETLQNEKEALQEELMTAENASIQYHHCLKEKDDLKGTMCGKEVKEQYQLHLQLHVTILALLVLVCSAWIAYMFITVKLKYSKLAKKAGHTNIKGKSASNYIECDNHGHEENSHA